MQKQQALINNSQNIQNQPQNHQNQFKRQGQNLHQLQNQVNHEQLQQNNKQKQQKQSKQSDLIQYGCIWGIQKFFDQKQCLKHFKKNFKIHSQQDSSNPIKLISLFKGKNRNFYIVQFGATSQSQHHLHISYDQFNNLYGKSKK